MAFCIPDKKEQKTGSFQECSEELGEHETKYPVLEKLCRLKLLKARSFLREAKHYVNKE